MLADKYPKMLASLATLKFLKSYYKDKSICKENLELFGLIS